MKIVILSGAGEPSYSSNKALTYAFRELGHEVLFIGPGYYDRYEADILLPDKPHIEYYSYEEVLSKLPWFPDLALCIDPHGFYNGPKPPGLISALVATDAHRAGILYYQVLIAGEYDYFFCGQPYFAPLYMDIPNTRVHVLPPAFDERRFMKGLNTSPKVDISFVGQTGIAGMEFPYEDDVGKYANKPPAGLPTDTRRYAFCGHPGFDYCERAEILIRLCKDFDVRMYDQVWEPLKFQKAIQRGVIGFNRSLLSDISIRAFETMAGERLLITDDPNGWFFENHFLSMTYQNYFKPFFANFDLDYKNIYGKIRRALNNNTTRESIAEHDFNLVWEKHTWRCRAQSILGMVFN